MVPQRHCLRCSRDKDLKDVVNKRNELAKRHWRLNCGICRPCCFVITPTVREYLYTPSHFFCVYTLHSIHHRADDMRVYDASSVTFAALFALLP